MGTGREERDSANVNAPDNGTGDQRWLQSVFKVRDDELRLVALSFAYFFLVLASYYALRPVRDQIGVAGGIRHLPWLFLGTLTTTVAISPVFSSLVSRLPRRRFVRWSYRSLVLCLLVFYALLGHTHGATQLWTGRVFFVWLSVFNIFAVSLFWAVMSDTFHTMQARRLYGLIGAGGTLGGLCGGVLTATLVHVVGVVSMLLISALLLEGALQCMLALSREIERRGGARAQVEQAVIGGGAFDGITRLARSPYLLGVGGFMLLYTMGSTFLYFLQAQIVAGEVHGAVARTQLFAEIDIWVNALTLLTQFGLTARVFSWIGVGGTLAFLPLVSLAGYTWLGLAPALMAVIVFQVIRRASNFSLTGPAREVLYVPLEREDKYKAKNFIDTFVFRGGDQIGAWTHAGLLALGFGVAGIAFAGSVLSFVWLALALWLGHRNRVLCRQSESATAT